jgi:hypothetical protein
MPPPTPTLKSAKSNRASVTLPAEISAWLGRRYPRSSKSAAISRVLSEARLGIFNAREDRADANADIEEVEARITTAFSERLDELERRIGERLEAEMPVSSAPADTGALRQQLEEIDVALSRLAVLVLPALGINPAEIENADAGPRPASDLAAAIMTLTTRVASLETGMKQLNTGIKNIPSELAAAMQKADDIFTPAARKMTAKELAAEVAKLTGAELTLFTDTYKKLVPAKPR